MKRPASKKQMFEAIRSALDCPGHYGKVKFVQTKEDKEMGFILDKDAIAICGQCVDRLRKAIGLEPGEDPYKAYGYWVPVRESNKDVQRTRKN